MQAFKKTVQRFNSLSKRSRCPIPFTWPRFLPADYLPDSFLQPLGDEIRQCLRNEKILLSEDATWETPASLMFVPSTYRWNDGSLILNSRRDRCICLSRNYSSADSRLLLSLGTQQMGFEKFLKHFKTFVILHNGTRFREKPSVWHSKVAQIVCKNVGIVPQKTSAIYRLFPFVTVGGLRVPRKISILILINQSEYPRESKSQS